MRIGTRGSALALAQADWVAQRVPGSVEIVPITTTGDRRQDVGDKSRWVSELEQALLEDRIDVAVHSAKDVPADLADGLELVAIPPRADARDAICGAASLQALRSGAQVGTSSLRRAAQIRAARDDLKLVEIRGNVDTRLRKLAEGKVDALVLARAGLQRLGREHEVSGVLDELVPAAGQGALALESRPGRLDPAALSELRDLEATACVFAERELTRALDASCNTSVGAHARSLGNGQLELRAWVGLPDGSAWCSDVVQGEPDGLGVLVAQRLLAAGAGELLHSARLRSPSGLAGGTARDPSGCRASAGSMTVYLVGAGPGDPGLLTARALERIADADVIIYDRLIPDSALEGAREHAVLIYAGKEGGGPSMPQAEIERLLLQHGREGKNVVRLKGGDPYVFGRGGEEAETLRTAGIPFEVVPGITAGVAATAYAGIPVTHRDAASAVAFVTGHEDPSKPESALDWDALARFPGTLVVYMGVRRLSAITERLIAAGRPESEPAALIQRGTLPDQRSVIGTLVTIASLARAEKITAPAIAVFGPVAALSSRLSWFTAPPLAGRVVAVTRARAQSSGLASRLRALGAEVVEAPSIRIVPLDGPAPDFARYDLLCLTSPNGVGILFERLARAGRDARALAGLRVAAIGPGTARVLEEHGITPDIVPERFVAEGLVQALEEVPVGRALIARAAEARDVLPGALRDRGAEVDVLALYETVAEPLSDSELDAVGRADYVTFTSSSTVRFFLEAAASRLSPQTRLVSIGPITSTALRERGHEPDVEAASHDIDGLVQALVADAQGGA